jgi:hypothetical protein
MHPPPPPPPPPPRLFLLLAFQLAIWELQKKCVCIYIYIFTWFDQRKEAVIYYIILHIKAKKEEEIGSPPRLSLCDSVF